MKGVFGEGASVLKVPEAARRAADSPQASAPQPDDSRSALNAEQLQRRAQSRGLWTSSDDVPAAPTTQPRADFLPRAVVGTPSPAANTNYRNPSIGSTDSMPAVRPPLASPAEPAIQAEVPAQALPEPAHRDGNTISVRPHAPEPSHRPAAEDAETMEIPLDQLDAKQPSAAPPARKSSMEQSRPPNTIVWLALILIAAVVAVWFIGAAIGFWSLPWGASPSGRGLNKAIPAKSLPEMHAGAPQTLSAPIAPPASPAQPTAAEPLAPAPEAAPAAEATAVVMEAEEAAPLRAPTLSGNNLDDLMDPPSSQLAPTLAAARAELRAGRPKEAEALLRPLLEDHPDDHHVAEALAQALLARGAAVEAVGFAQRIVKQQPKRASYRVLLGDALRRAGDEPSAKLAYKNALALDPKLRDAQRRLKNRRLSGSTSP